MTNLKRIADQHDRNDAEDQAYPLTTIQSFPEQSHCEERGQHQSAAVDDGENTALSITPERYKLSL